MKYRYYINEVEVFPKGEWVINYQRNEGQIFFRRIFEGELTFFNDDYNFIMGLDCEIATFDIWCGGAIHWEGQFQYPYKAKFDDDSCTVVLTPEVVDEYTCIMNNYETKYSFTIMAATVAPELWTCPAPGGNIHNFPNFSLLGMPSPAGAVDAYLNELITNRPTMMDCNIDLRSSFLWRDNYANGDAYAGTDNYITGATNRLEYIYLAKNTALRVSFGGTGCTSDDQLFSFKDFEELLRNAFNAYWFVDENGDFRIEHIYYFDPAFPHSDYTVGQDLNTVMDRGGRSFAYRKNKYEYETGRLYDQEKWSWQHYEGTESAVAHGADFEGVPVFYGAAEGDKSDYVPGVFKEKEIASPRFWADIDWGFTLIAAPGANPDDIECPGFCMLDVITTAPNNKINCEVGAITGVSQPNGHLSTANLQDHYHQYDRIFTEGNMNNNAVSFQTAQKHKLQDPIEFPLCCDESFDPLNRIRTGLGDGEVKAAIQKKQSMEVELWHEFDCAELAMCVEENERMCFDGVNNTVLLDAIPDTTGNKIIEFCCFIPSGQDYTGANSEVLFHFRDGSDADYFGIWMLDLGVGATPLMVINVSSTAGNNQRINVIPYLDAPFHVEVSKGVESINYVRFNGQLVSGVGGSAMGGDNTRNIGWLTGGLASYYFYGTIWDIKITGSHWWEGHPAGNTNPAWVDQIGAIDGAVAGAPALWPC